MLAQRPVIRKSTIQDDESCVVRKLFLQVTNEAFLNGFHRNRFRRWHDCSIDVTLGL